MATYIVLCQQLSNACPDHVKAQRLHHIMSVTLLPFQYVRYVCVMDKANRALFPFRHLAEAVTQNRSQDEPQCLNHQQAASREKVKGEGSQHPDNRCNKFSCEPRTQEMQSEAVEAERRGRGVFSLSLSLSFHSCSVYSESRSCETNTSSSFRPPALLSASLTSPGSRHALRGPRRTGGGHRSRPDRLHILFISQSPTFDQETNKQMT